MTPPGDERPPGRADHDPTAEVERAPTASRSEGEDPAEADPRSADAAVTDEKLRPPEKVAPPPRPFSRVSSAFRGVALFSPGDLVAGRFRIVRFIASGGMGEVYEAEDLELREQVALKTVRPEITEDERVMERFRREIQLARRVTHPSVCRSFDVFRHRLTPPPGWQGPIPEVTFLTMELLRGETLAERVRSKGALTTDEALPIVHQVAAALAAAHEAGIVHRDLKSANVMLVPAKRAEAEVRAVVTDFGLARGGTSTAGRGASLTDTGALAGTPAYMAPEQVEGGAITPATDVYALGVVMYEMVTGRWPFEGDTPLATAMMRLNDRPPSPRTHLPSLPRRWEAAILRCLERDPAERFAHALDVMKALTGERLAPSPGQTRAKRRVRLALAGSLVALLALGLLFARAPKPQGAKPPSAQSASRRAVAVLGFKNLSGRDDTAWLTKALSEMLSMELAAGEKLRMIPSENVARIKLELALPETDSLAPDTLVRIRANLATDLVVLGSYFAGGPDSGGRLRVDLRVQDAAAGETVASVSETATEAELLELVARAGSQLRQKLGVAELSATEAGGARASLPANPEAARLFAEGLAKLRSFDALAARDLLEKAVKADPSYPLTHAALAEAWVTLGYDDNAKREAKQAVELSSNLSREERLSVEGRYRETTREWQKALEAYRLLWGFFPDSLEYGLRLAGAQTSSGKAKDALAALEVLRALPAPASQDPRIDLAEANAAEALGDYKREAAAASRAAAKGSTQGARLVVAQARSLEGYALMQLGEAAKATVATEEARRIFAESGDRGGVARTLNRFGALLWQQGHLAEARGAFGEALSTFREIGDRRGLGRVLNNLAIVLYTEGDLAGAKRMYEEALGIAREVGDRRGAAIRLYNIAEATYAQGRLAEAKKLYGEALQSFHEIGEKAFSADILRGLGDVFSSEGDLARARAKYQEALAASHDTSMRTYAAHALFGLAELCLAEGDLAGARKQHEEALAIRSALGERVTVAESRLALARLSIEAGHPGEAEEPARRALQVFAKENAADNEASAQAVLARSLLAQGKAKEAETVVDRAIARSGKSQNPHVRVFVAVTAASIRAETGSRAQAAKTAGAALADASRLGLVARQLEARLALCEIELRSGNSAARPRLLALATEASAKGFHLIAGKARRAAA